MIRWDEDPIWSQYHLEIYKSFDFDYGFGIISGESPVPKSDKSILINSYCRLQLAHIFHGSVVLFFIESLRGVGSPLLNAELGFPKLHHIPPRCYSYLEDLVADRPFLINDEGLRKIRGLQGLSDSIFRVPDELHEKEGLVVLGIRNVHEKTQETV